eukprot:CAMPEP_0185028500 /NCGR_PEP_ID=MMETSP1103-20130426/14234_1 /TAXON_ID=36769 /ORGANISM="Paraphysomonas bandaiensis, Strain Caron Lab Isolate" /LENGTH=646 /DNA_ID=CAMNT_0027562927 /DNA_START=62 /DNA_END=1999 /DNA_ORIENTATION=-
MLSIVSRVRNSSIPSHLVVKRSVSTATKTSNGVRKGTCIGVSLGLLTLGVSYCNGNKKEEMKNVVVNGIDEFSSVIVGGGTGGCTTAYLLAKWMEEHKIPGTVLVVDRGVAFSPEEGPDPKMWGWFDNWGSFGEAHMTLHSDGSHYPVTATDHKGFGGCGSHDTRITYQLRPEQQQRMSDFMGWSVAELNVYYQAALNLMPLYRANPVEEPFYTACIDALTKNGPLKRIPGDEYKSRIVVDSIAQCSMAMFGSSELRWTSAYLLHDAVRPKNLVVLSCADVQRVELERKSDGKLTAHSVVIVRKDGTKERAQLSNRGCVAITSGALGAPAVLQRSGIGPAEKLRSLDIDVVVDNAEVGHGVDHPEIAVRYAWLDKWNEADGNLPRGGVTGWPLNIFASIPLTKGDSRKRNTFMQAHFGAGFAEPYTDFPSVVMTPSCVQPDPSAGFRATITSTDPTQSLYVVHDDQRGDLEVMAKGVQCAVGLMDTLKKEGVCGERIEPEPEVDINNTEVLMDWIKENHGTVFHWASTCKAGRNGAVADERFRVRDNANAAGRRDGVIDNLFVGSAAALPEIPESNPHLSVTAFSFALAKEMLWAMHTKQPQSEWAEPEELRIARRDLFGNHGSPVIRRPGEERPAIAAVANEHYK